MLQNPHEIRSVFDERKIAFADAAPDELALNEHACPRPPVQERVRLMDRFACVIRRASESPDGATAATRRGSAIHDPKEMKEVGICANMPSRPAGPPLIAVEQLQAHRRLPPYIYSCLAYFS